MTNTTQRHVDHIMVAHPSRDGAGVAISRIAGFDHPRMDPFLMIDELRSEYRDDFAAGFPPHPHRGMQTLTYMKHGGLLHEDSLGNQGAITSGGAQWMSAGKGVIHSEMPTQDSVGLHGFQLWINLPADEKMAAPRYRDVPAQQIAHHVALPVTLHALAGSWRCHAHGQSPAELHGPLAELAEYGAILDIELSTGTALHIDCVADETVLVLVYNGALLVGDNAVQPVTQGQLAVTSPGNIITLATDAPAACLILRGTPLGEPVAHYGPFVMNTRAQLEQAVRDYQNGQFI